MCRVREGSSENELGRPGQPVPSSKVECKGRKVPEGGKVNSTDEYIVSEEST
jgi:hypothetical protein